MDIWQTDRIPSTYMTLELIFMWMVNFDYSLNLITSRHKILTTFSLTQLLDFVTIPTFVVILELVGIAFGIQDILGGSELDTGFDLRRAGTFVLRHGYLRFGHLIGRSVNSL